MFLIANVKIQMLDLDVKIQMTYFETQFSKIELQTSNFKLLVGDNSSFVTQQLI